MTLLKLWDGSQWRTVQGLAGPQGPVGPQGVGALTSGPAGGALSGTYPNPDAPGAGGLLAVQRLWGQNNAYRAITTSQNYTVDAAGATPLSVSYTPTIPVWWEVECSIGILNKLDAAYHNAYVTLVLSPADSDGLTSRSMVGTQHSGVQTYEFRNAGMWWKLPGDGRIYTCTAVFSCSGGSWQFNQGSPYLWISGRVFAQ